MSVRRTIWQSGAAPGDQMIAHALPLQDDEGHHIPFGSAGPERARGKRFVFKDSQRVVKSRLTKSVLRLFTKLTGLSFHVLWHPTPDGARRRKSPPACPVARQMFRSGDQVAGICRACLRRNWRFRLRPSKRVHRFNGQCGTANLHVGVRVANGCPLTLALQARITGSHLRSNRTAAGSRRRPDDLKPATSLRCVNAAQFKTAERLLLRLILTDLEATIRARMAEAELREARRRLQRLEAGRTAQGGELGRPGCPVLAAPMQQPAGCHARQITRMMLDFIHQHYQRPMALRDVAAELCMNASYLSDLFSKTMGLTFHRYVDELRLAKAKGLLSDPRICVCEVACAVGYASANHFRSVFKAHEGVSPSVWRVAPLQ